MTYGFTELMCRKQEAKHCNNCGIGNIMTFKKIFKNTDAEGNTNTILFSQNNK